jgi:hypothetical protein
MIDLQEKYDELVDKLDKQIELVKKETDPIAKENLFDEVMKLAWAQNTVYLEMHPEIMMHPHEYVYRDACGFPKEIDKNSVSTVKQMYEFTKKLVEEGKGDAIILFDTEAKTYDYHMAEVGRGFYEDDVAVGYPFVSLHERRER